MSLVRLRLWWCAALAFAAIMPMAVSQEPLEPLSEDDGADAPAAVSGDVIHLKSGSVLDGVQILRSTPVSFFVELVKGVEPMEIPRVQVESVEYDDYDPARERLKAELFPESTEVSLASGEKVSQDLMEKLSGPVSDEEVAYENEDLVVVLEAIAERLGVTIRIDESVRSLQPNRRQWTTTTTPDTTLITLLREELVANFKFAEVIFENDAVLVMTKKAAQERQAQSGDSEN